MPSRDHNMLGGVVAQRHPTVPRIEAYETDEGTVIFDGENPLAWVHSTLTLPIQQQAYPAGKFRRERNRSLVRSENEPPDPGADDGGRSYEPDEPALGPEPPDPTPQADGMFGPSGTSHELLVGFWSLVVLFNVALFGIAVGLMLVAFRGDVAFGGALLALGVLAAVHGAIRYRRLKAREELWDDQTGRNG